ncbi:MAG: CHAT domain-containing protein, partial [Bacteroidales bacterium]|nr:CHAT domain-containing protein [Bacteroidales bacterium]
KLAVIILLITSCNLQKNNNEINFFFQKGESFYQQNRFYEAIPHYWRTIQISTSTDTLALKAYFQLFYCYYRLSNYTMLDSVYSHIFAIYPLDSFNFKTDYYRVKALYLSSKRKYPEAIKALQEAIHSQQKPLLKDYYQLGVLLFQMNQIDSAQYYFRKTIREAYESGDTSNFILSMAYCNLANYEYYYKGDMERAKILFDSMLWVHNHSPKIDSSHFAWNLESYGVFLQTKGYINQASELYEKAYKIYSRLPGNFEFDISSLLISQATIDYYMQKNSVALSKIDQAIQFFKEKKEPYYLAVAHTVRANILFGKGEYQQALNEYFSILDLYNSAQLLRKEEIYYLIGRCYMKINNLDSADYWLQRSITHLSGPSTLLVNYCCTYSNFLLSAGKPQQALAILEQNFPYVRIRFGGKNQQMIHFLTMRAKVLERLGKYNSSLATYNQIFELISDNYTGKTSNYALPEIGKIDYELANEIVAALEGKAELLSKIAGNEKGILISSLQHYQKASEIADTYKKSIPMEIDKILYNEYNTQISEKIFELAIKLWKISKYPGEKNYYYQLAFNVSNSLKANVLTENIIENSLKKIAGIPDSIQQKENILLQNILYLQNAIRDEYRQANPNHALIKDWQKQLVSYLSMAQEIEQNLESQYPLYRELKYQHRKIFTIKELQYKLAEKENLLSYHWLDNMLYLFLINKQTSKLIIINDSSLSRKIEQFRNILTHPSLDENFTKDFFQYITLSYHLFHKLFAPAKPYLQGNNIIIIPDRQLHYIPFEAFISDTIIKNNVPDYGMLSYLIYHYNIRYSYSVHLFDFQQNNVSPVAKGVLAFAPTYQNQGKETAKNRTAIYRSQLAPLPGALEEATNITKIIGGHAFKGRNATEAIFRDKTKHGYILHLAMHTLVDDENPIFSKLAFYSGEDSMNDGFLNAYEIYGLRFSTPLVVLSACNTGYGKMMKGEGIYSLARGFIYGGCPALVFTLWQISDKPSKNLMEFFYHHVKRGENIEFALRNAKIQYIVSSNSSMAHPYYWAAFCLSGKNNPIQFFKGYHQFIWIGSIITIALFVILLILYHLRHRL